ncbi:MAG: PadR family transcriptional regulator [Oscillospiraceae bacterium]|nr:PadR family transcriptional regulator [Oscillospiraceae bacterium]
MNTQFKKGVLEMVVLLSISQQDKYGYQLVSEVGQTIDVNEGTIYPLLKRLVNDGYCQTYLEQSAEGPARKYYRITSAGHTYLNVIIKEWLVFSRTVNRFIERSDICEQI